ncbi:MAG: glycoside hydrolase family 127 protein [Lachnospiraceae bacterium]|nr:glycoside hydrolase family 127 protein [Lachnospiraceae bacterium]
MDLGKLALAEMDLDRTTEGREREVAEFLIREQFLNGALWKKFVDQFRERIDGDTAGWRGEFWGKSMRGAAMIYRFFPDPDLYRAMTETVRDMLTAADPDGKVTSYTGENEYRVWDLWCRKYVMLGMEYYYVICGDDALKSQIVSFLKGLADDILCHVGKEDGKIPITSSGRWKGVNSSSILEPMVKLYRMTDEKRYLDFASYIVGEGCAEGIDLFECAFEDKKMPYQYGVTKAYEIMSCFEGLYEYYLVTGVEKYRETVIRFAEALMKSEVTTVGSIGLTHELFDHGAVRETAPHDDVLQETCVTVTWMKLLSRLFKLTGDPKYADEIEKSWFNAYLGAVNFRKNDSPYMYAKFVKKYGCPVLKRTFLPFDSYSPITAARRGSKVGGNQMLSDGSYFGCCAAIGGAGVATYLGNAVVKAGDGVCLVLYQNGKYRFRLDGEDVLLSVDTDYPIGTKVRVGVEKTGEKAMKLRMRIPGWCESCSFTEPSVKNGGWIVADVRASKWSAELDFAMPVKRLFPMKWEEDQIVLEKQTIGPVLTSVRQSPEELDYVAFKRGPVVFALDERLGRKADANFDLKPEIAHVVPGKNNKNVTDAGIDAAVTLELTEKDGNTVTLMDYASAGQDWKSIITVWLHHKNSFSGIRQ